MSRRSSSWRRSSVAATTDSISSSRPAARSASGWSSVLRFGASVVLFAALITFLALPWVALSWWKIFRRSVSIASALSLWLCITRLEHRSIRSYGFAAGGAGKREWWFGLLVGGAALAFMLGIGLATGICRISITPERKALAHPPRLSARGST